MPYYAGESMVDSSNLPSTSGFAAEPEDNQVEAVDLLSVCLQIQPLHMVLLLKGKIVNTNLLTMNLLLVATMCSIKLMDRQILRLH